MNRSWIKAVQRVLLAAAVLTSNVAFAQDDGPTVATRSGWVQGIREADADVFRGISYAAPPVGALRWQAPRRPEPWAKLHRAHQFGSSTTRS